VNELKPVSVKNFTLLFLLIFFALSCALAQDTAKLSPDKVPPAVIKAFKIKFPNAQRETWTMPLANIYNAVFYQADKMIGASFDINGQFTGYMLYVKDKEEFKQRFKEEMQVLTR
jgi:hypothetical protein